MMKEPKMEIDPDLIKEAMESVERHQRESSSEKDDGGDGEERSAEKSEGNEIKGDKSKWAGMTPDELYERLLRVSADFENFRKRVQKEKSELLLYGNENLVREILPVVDNFERAVEHSQKATDVDAVRKGVELILTQLKTMLERSGVRAESAAGKKFDPLVHEAVSQAPSDVHPAQTVMEEHQKAYFLHQRLIRPAVVTVSKGPEGQKVEEPNDLEENQDSTSGEK